MTHVPPEVRHRFAAHGQEHVMAGWDDLSPSDRAAFVEQLAGVDLGELEALFQRRDEPYAILPPRERIAPLPVEPVEATTADRACGEDALSRGAVAVLLVAGGQGTRLGLDKPKGMYPVGPVSGASLFQIHAEKVLALTRRYGKPVPFLVMTSPATHTDTEAYFRASQYFGLAPADVAFFQQGAMPAVDLATGRLLLERVGQLALSPNGHGGTLTALAKSGLLADMTARGVEHIFYFQVDNPLVKICDPGFVGRHVGRGADASSKVVFKEQPEEKVGVLALVDGKCGIIEYSDLPSQMAVERRATGELVFRAGNPAIHLFSTEFLRRVTGHGGLAYHIARKKVPYYDVATGQQVTPAEVNALKFELFIFDALPMADRPLAVEIRREEEFAPLKNATGADSPETVFQLMTRLHANWLERAGAAIPRTPSGDLEFPVEVSPLFALSADECLGKVSPGLPITEPTYFR